MAQTTFVKCLSWERVFWIFTKAVITRNIKKKKWREAPRNLAAKIYMSREYMQSWKDCHKIDRPLTSAQVTPSSVKFQLSVVKTKFLNNIFSPCFFSKIKMLRIVFQQRNIFFLAIQKLSSHFLKLLWWLENKNKSSFKTMTWKISELIIKFL